MGKIATILVALLVCVGATSIRAADFYVINSQYIVVHTNSFTATNSGSAVVTNIVSVIKTVNHTFQFSAYGVGTNTAAIAIDRTIDGSNWNYLTTNVVTGANNVLTSPITNTPNGIVQFETNFSGKWTAYRFRITLNATNNGAVTEWDDEQ